MQDDLLALFSQLAEPNTHATSAVGIFVLHIVTALASQPGFDVAHLYQMVEKLHVPDDLNEVVRDVYGMLKSQLLANLDEIQKQPRG